VAVQQRGGRRAAERDLEERDKRVKELAIHPLPEESRRRYSSSWQHVQAQFVDDPSAAVREADRLISDVMNERGYPTEQFLQREADLSTQYPQVIDQYRRAHAISVKNDSGEANTEDLRQAFVSYRSLFEELLGERRAA
jgi:hypothetical protein